MFDLELTDDRLQKSLSSPLNFHARESQKKTSIDLLFMCDTTSSMFGEISVAQETIKNIMSELKKRCNGRIRFGLIAYKDYCDGADVIKSYDFTEDLSLAKSYVDQMNASGGGDSPEALGLALHHATLAQFSPSAKRYCVLIADAPPHGLGSADDTMPNGEEHDWLECASKLSEMNVVCYTCVCDRSKNDDRLTLFMDTVARKTNGRCILLTNSSKIPAIIINGTTEDLEIENVVSQYIKELGTAVNTMSQQELNAKIQEHFEKNRVKVNTVQVINCTNTNSASLASFSKINNEARGLFGSGATQAVPSHTTGAFSFGSSSFGAPSMQQVQSATSRVTKGFSF